MTPILAALITALLFGLLVAGILLSQRRLRRAGLPGLSAVLVRNARAASSEKNGETIIHLEGQPEGLALNRVAGKCWELSDGTRTVFQIARIVASNYSVTLTRALREVRSFSRRLKLALLALEPQEWDLMHIHDDDLFAGTKSPGVVEVALESGLIVHAAACLQGADGTLRPWRGTRQERRAGGNAMRAHHKDEAPLECAAREFKKGWDHCVAGRLQEARAAFLKCAESAPEWANAWYQVGYIHLRMRLYADAAKFLRRAEKLSPGLFMVREYLDQALRLASGGLSHEAFLLLLSRGSIFQAQGRPEMALKEWEKVIELNGSSSATKSALASMTSAGWVH